MTANLLRTLRRRPARLAHLLALILGILVISTPSPLHAQTRSFRWLNFDSDITLLANGDLRIVETQTLEFVGSYSNGYAVIYTGKSGRNDGIRNVQVSENGVAYSFSSSGLPQTYYVSESGDETYIDWYFEPASGRHTYTFSYIVAGAVRVEDNGDQLFWSAIPTDHPGLIDASRVTIRLPDGVTAGSTTARVGGYEDVATTTVSDNGRTVVFELNSTLGYGQAFEAGVRFEHGLLDLDTPDWQRGEQSQDTLNLALIALGVFLAIAGPGFVLVRWYMSGRDPETGPIADYLSAPPDDLPPGLVGTLVDEKADMRDIMATLVDLARRGYLTMEEKDRDFIFRRGDKHEKDLLDYEKKLFLGVFSGKKEQNLDGLKNRFYTKLPKIRAAMYKEMVTRGLMPQSPDTVRNNYRGMGGFLMFIPVFASICGLAAFGDWLPSTLVCPAIAIILTGFVLIFLGGHMPSKTFKGAEAAARWEAFRRYLEDVRRYGNLEDAAANFETYLPYAIAFGIERHWLNEMSAVPDLAGPAWFVARSRHTRTFLGIPVDRPAGNRGQGGLEGASRGLTQGLTGMSTSLTRMLNSAASTFKSAPSSSGSSGGGSSGFSGGFSGGSSGGGSRGFS